MSSADEAIRTLDTGIYAAIRSETSQDDRKSFLALQNCVRARGEYVYLEIGSFVGGTLQPFYADDLCRLIFSIDKRPDFVPDERGRQWYHYDQQVNSTSTMLGNLSKAFPSADSNKVRTFDCGSKDVDTGQITDPPELCFIDAEHTNTAVVEDFEFCLSVCHTDAIVAFHDAGIIFGGIGRIKELLRERSIPFQGLKLGGSVYAILLNGAADKCASDLGQHTLDEALYFEKAEQELARAREEYSHFGKRRIKEHLTKLPLLFRFLRGIKRLFVRPTKRQI